MPGWLFFYGASAVLVASFVALGTLWRRPTLERAAAGRELPEGLQRVLPSPALRVAVTSSRWSRIRSAAVAGLAVAHDRAVALFRSPGHATRSQYAMLVLMVLYTVGGMRLLATG